MSSPNRGKRILIYSHDTFGLGNIRRMMAIAKHLVDANGALSILIMSGSPMLHAFQLRPRIDYVKLPCLSRTIQGNYAVKYLGMEYNRLVKMRSSIICNAIRGFEPDLLLVDKKPLGVANELYQALRKDAMLRGEARAKRVLLLRDILDEPETTKAQWRKHAYHKAIERFYDQVLVVGTPDIFDVRKEYAFAQGSAKKTRFCGYIRREPGHRTRESIRNELGLTTEPLVLVTVGGGEDGYRVISSYIEGLAALPHRPHFHTLLLCGPEMPVAQRESVRERSSKLTRVSVLDFTNDLMSYMDAADVVVSMGGYNTICEILSLDKRAIVVPRIEPVQEQWIRAQRLAERGLIRTIHPHELTASVLIDTVISELRNADTSVGDDCMTVDLDALHRIREHLDDLMHAPSRCPRSPRRLVTSLQPGAF